MSAAAKLAVQSCCVSYSQACCAVYALVIFALVFCLCLSFAFLFASALQHAFFPFAEGWQGMRDGFESVRTHIEHQGQRML